MLSVVFGRSAVGVRIGASFEATGNHGNRFSSCRYRTGSNPMQPSVPVPLCSHKFVSVAVALPVLSCAYFDAAWYTQPHSLRHGKIQTGADNCWRMQIGTDLRSGSECLQLHHTTFHGTLSNKMLANARKWDTHLKKEIERRDGTLNPAERTQ